MDVKNNFLAIVSGYKNVIFPSKDMEKLAHERAKICAECENCDPNFKFKKVIGNFESIEEIKGMGCKKCGCFLTAKTRQLYSKCPERKWAENERGRY